MTIPASRRDELRPCPFCGRTDLLGFEPRPDSHFVGVRCRACGCIGPSKLALDESESTAHWNNQKRVIALDTELGEAKLVIEQQDRDLERLRETNEQAAKAFAVVDDLCAQAKDRIVALETALGEAVNWIEDRCEDGEAIIVDRLRKVLG